MVTSARSEKHANEQILSFPIGYFCAMGMCNLLIPDKGLLGIDKKSHNEWKQFVVSSIVVWGSS